MDSPKNIIVKNSFPKQHLDAFLAAYKEFKDDLEDIKITLVGEQINEYWYMVSQFNYDCLYKNKKNRSYILKTNLNKNKNIGLITNKLTFDEKKGWYLHELGHIKDYKNKSVLQLIGFGVKYGSAYGLSLKCPNWQFPFNYLKKVENQTHDQVINKGLGSILGRSVIYQNSSEKIPNKNKHQWLRNIYSEEYVINKTIEHYLNKINSPRKKL